MPQISTLRLCLLRGMYLLIAVGLGLTIWPSIIAPSSPAADPHSVIRALLGGLSLMCLLGLRHPLKMLPLLLFELAWKVIWVVASALPAWRAGTLDAYGSESLFACLMGVVLVPLVVPWGHVWRTYVRGPGEPWRVRRGAAAPR
ncbi:hypothetical protein [Pseudoxanthomonas daejeonensis]|uniref:Transmembrane protein n=1 Tax=Pseudoxanthomonas daejeonensis TaxID=266062 RepID=A0ABQ6Z4L4_9GAMM|nr:hypothetical protein [Pseudoxanthomonas daejeonensis]KAF1692795.1 hypothetical protein CSC65_13320 [Pseudoxanthomonas daejeonensis]